jgi:murein DD-endopeptidase MepM/ murein hydrolase activator NlpD
MQILILINYKKLEVIMGRREYYEEQKLKKLVYVFASVLIISVVVFLTVFVMYNKKLKESSNQSLLELGKMSEIVSNEDLEETSFSSDKSVNSSNNTIKNEVTNTASKKVNKVPVEAVVENTVVENTTTNEIVENEVVEPKELIFGAPVSGEIIKDFARDTLIYSNTLEEWTIHNGIDIKADKMSVVVASEAGTVESIKNDPRYGLTITIAHENGFKTIYSNLLTTEFVTENEVVEKGQTIGTVGESSSFEIADESHLHFEMYKDGELVNPTIYLK